jgi:hypothetical protein
VEIDCAAFADMGTWQRGLALQRSGCQGFCGCYYRIDRQDLLVLSEAGIQLKLADQLGQLEQLEQRAISIDFGYSSEDKRCLAGMANMSESLAYKRLSRAGLFGRQDLIHRCRELPIFAQTFVASAMLADQPDSFLNHCVVCIHTASRISSSGWTVAVVAGWQRQH